MLGLNQPSKALMCLFEKMAAVNIISGRIILLTKQ